MLMTAVGQNLQVEAEVVGGGLNGRCHKIQEIEVKAQVAGRWRFV